MFFDVQRLCFSYYRSPMTLKDVSFSLKKNSKALILASKDMGKTTSLKVLSGFEDSRFGNIYLNGKELKQIDDKDKNFSLVLSEPVLFEKKSIKYNLDYQCEVCGKEKLSDEKLNRLLKDFKLSKDLNTKVKKLSLFEKRIIQLIRSVIKGPSVLFLDDQFEDLSEDERLNMLVIYEKLLNDEKLTIIYTISDESFKFLKEQNFNFNCEKILYLNLANVQEFKTIGNFCNSYSSLDILKFYGDIDLENCYIEKDKASYFLCKDENKLFKFDSEFTKKLDELKLEFGDIEEVLIYSQKDRKINELDSAEFNKGVKEKLIFIYSNLTGNLVI